MEIKNILISVIVFSMVIGVFSLTLNDMSRVSNINVNGNLSENYNQINNVNNQTATFLEQFKENPLKAGLSTLKDVGGLVLTGAIQGALALTSAIGYISVILNQISEDLGLPNIIIQSISGILFILISFGIYKLIKTGT